MHGWGTRQSSAHQEMKSIAGLTPGLLARAPEYGSRVVARARLRRVVDAAQALDPPPAEDALHDFRVALRRLRTWLAAFEPELGDTVTRGSVRGLRRLARRTGKARDLEVALGWLAAPTARLGPLAATAARALAAELQVEHGRALDRARQAVHEDLPALRRKLDKQLRRYEVRVPAEAEGEDRTMAVAVGRLLDAAGRQLRAALEDLASPEQGAEAHQARLDVKRLRYLVESLAGTRADAGRIAARLATLQDALGRFHDRQVLLDRVSAEILAQGPRRPLTALHAALVRAAAREFRSAHRVAIGRTFRSALAGVDRTAASLGGSPPEQVSPTPGTA
jgi:CHAD domain-containing protein